jgi:acyl carrier protein
VPESPTREKVKHIMAATFRVPVGQIPDNATPETVAGWDSLGHIELMLALEMEFGVPLPTETIIELVSLEAIEGFLQGQSTAVAK